VFLDPVLDGVLVNLRIESFGASMHPHSSRKPLMNILQHTLVELLISVPGKADPHVCHYNVPMSHMSGVHNHDRRSRVMTLILMIAFALFLGAFALSMLYAAAPPDTDGPGRFDDKPASDGVLLSPMDMPLDEHQGMGEPELYAPAPMMHRASDSDGP
jgi:hypothetical protein